MWANMAIFTCVYLVIRDAEIFCGLTDGQRTPRDRGVTVYMRPPTLDDHNFLVRTPIRVFLDSTKSTLSLESGHMHVNGIWCPHIF